MKQLIKDIRNIVVIGSGYVGLPTAALFAEAGFQVMAVDIKPEVIEAVNSGVSPINEPGLQELISANVRAGRLKASLNEPVILSQAEAFIISVQTPIDENKKPNLSFLINALGDVSRVLKRGMLIIISSTIPPGTTMGLVKSMLESLSGLEVEEDFYLAYVPERIAPGRALKEFIESPRLVGGVGPHSTKIAAELFRTVCKTVIETNAAMAEVAKLAENTFRDVNIAFANELALICEQYGVDVMEVIRLANTHPRVNIHMPGPGVGGPCLPKDPYLLIRQAETAEHDMIKMARKINDYMPKHVVKLILKALKDVGKEIESCRIAILGTAYKADIDDSRLSPAEPIIRSLLDLGVNLVVYDPYCKEGFGAQRASSLKEAINGTDCLVLLTDHKEFRSLNLMEVKMLMSNRPIIVDAKRFVNPLEAEKLGFIYYGVGFVKRGGLTNKSYWGSRST